MHEQTCLGVLKTLFRPALVNKMRSLRTIEVKSTIRTTITFTTRSIRRRNAAVSG